MKTITKIKEPKFADDMCVPLGRTKSFLMSDWKDWETRSWHPATQFYRSVDAYGYMRVHRDEVQVGDEMNLPEEPWWKLINVAEMNYAIKHNISIFCRFIPLVQRIQVNDDFTAVKESNVVPLREQPEYDHYAVLDLTLKKVLSVPEVRLHITEMLFCAFVKGRNRTQRVNDWLAEYEKGLEK